MVRRRSGKSYLSAVDDTSCCVARDVSDVKAALQRRTGKQQQVWAVPASGVSASRISPSFVVSAAFRKMGSEPPCGGAAC